MISENKERAKKESIYFKLFVVMFLVFFLTAALRYCCVLPRKFGPYMGKVVETETLYPIEGAVVILAFNTRQASPGGEVWSFADAVEILTDSNGEFNISKRINMFKPFAYWDKECEISIFKPGYAAYPGHPQTFRSPELKGFIHIQENKYNTYYLTRLLTLDERKRNLDYIRDIVGLRFDKTPLLRNSESEERFTVGLKAYSKLKK